jgi:hypothetical protein
MEAEAVKSTEGKGEGQRHKKTLGSSNKGSFQVENHHLISANIAANMFLLELPYELSRLYLKQVGNIWFQDVLGFRRSQLQWQ